MRRGSRGLPQAKTECAALLIGGSCQLVMILNHSSTSVAHASRFYCLVLRSICPSVCGLLYLAPSLADTMFGRDQPPPMLTSCCLPGSAGANRYDKSAFQGRGDRADPSTWPVVEGPLELVFFEGWMSGFRPVGEAAAAAVEASLVEVDRRLAAYEQAWDSLVDAWLVIRIGDPQVNERAAFVLQPVRVPAGHTTGCLSVHACREWCVRGIAVPITVNTGACWPTAVGVWLQPL